MFLHLTEQPYKDAALNTTTFFSGMLLCLLASGAWADTSGHKASETPDDASLLKTVTQLDSDLFGAFNACAAPGEIDKHARLLDANLEFYHDKGGVSWTRKDYIDKVRENVCGKFRRVLTPGTIEVSPIAGFGAIETGTHSFCEIPTGKCTGTAKFLIAWHQTDHGWEATRIFSYQHMPLH